LFYCLAFYKEKNIIQNEKGEIKMIESNKDYLRFYWKSVLEANQEKKKFLVVFFKHQKEFENKKIGYENLSPYEFQLDSTFKKIVLNKNNVQVIVNWNKGHKIGYEFDINKLDVLIEKKGITFQDIKSQYHKKKITIFFE